MKKTLILCVVLLTLSACTRIKNKVESVITNCAITECHIGSLYSDLKGKDCDGIKIDDGIFYNYCFRYKAIPAEVENALMAKTCSYVEIVPDSVLVPCKKNIYSTIFNCHPKKHTLNMQNGFGATISIVLNSINAQEHRYNIFLYLIR